jgi:sulfide:quinone oxidoreductase
MPEASQSPFRVVIAGGGVAALEGALALREVGGDRISTTLIAPNSDFIYRPMSVRAPFGFAGATRYPLEQMASDIGVDLLPDKLSWVDPARRVVHTDGGAQLPYDALLLALGARMNPRFRDAITVDDSRLDELMHGLIQDVEGGYVHRLAFVIPDGMGWPLPMYELALMTAGRAYDMNVDLSVTIVTPEETPLAVFGLGASQAIEQLLEDNHIDTITSAHAEIPEARRVVIHPGTRELRADRIVAMPELSGPSVRGIPGGSTGGFIPIDAHSKVRGVECVYAAGDATDFAIKHGGISAQQADVAARAIGALAGLCDAPPPLHPIIHGVLLTGDKPRYLTAHINGGHGSHSGITETPPSGTSGKIAARYLAPYLEERDRLAVNTA